MSYRTTNYAWKKRWQEFVPDGDLDRLEADSGSARRRQKCFEDSSVIYDIVTMGQSMALEENADNIEEI